MDTIEITRFILNPKKKKRSGVVYETWLVQGERWVRGSSSIAYGGASVPEPGETKGIRITAVGRRVLRIERPVPAADSQPLTRPRTPPPRPRWEPAVPSDFARSPRRRRSEPTAADLCPFQSLGVRGAHGW